MFKRDGFWAKVLTVLLTVAMTLIATPLDGVAEAVNGSSDFAVVQKQESSEKSQDTSSSMSDKKDTDTSNSSEEASKSEEAAGKSADSSSGDSTGKTADSTSSDGKSGSDNSVSESKGSNTSDNSSKETAAVPETNESSNDAAKNDSDDQSTFKAYWTNAADSEISYTNDGYSAGDASTQKDFSCTPKDNSLHKSTMKVYLKLAGDSKTIYKAGTVKIEIPAGFYRGLDKSDSTLVACEDDNSAYTHWLSQINWMIPKAPEANDVTSFNYIEETKELDGQQVKYYVMQNEKDITGATELDVDIDYRYRPTLLNVTAEIQKDRSDMGVFQASYPVTCTVNSSKIAEDELGVTVRTKVNPSKVTLAHASQDANKGIFYTWDDSWGEKPADADKYFYIVWYAQYDRARYSSMPYTYTLNIDTGKTDGGELIGVQRCTFWGGYGVASDMLSKMDHSYKGIEGNLDLLGQSSTGISNSPLNKVNSLNYFSTDDYAGNHTSQIFVLLFRYPLSKISDAIKSGVDMAKDGIKIGNGLTLTETWQDGHQVTTSIEPTGDTSVKSSPNVQTGTKTLDKYRDTMYKHTLTVQAAQAMLDQGQDVTLPDYHLHSYNYDGNVTWDSKSNSYRAATGFDITDGSYYLFSSAPEYTFGEGIDAVSKNDPLKLSDGEYSLTSFYIDDSERDISYVEGLGWQNGASASKNYTSYVPVEVWIRTAEETDLEKLGQFVRMSDGSYTFNNSIDGSSTENVGSKNRMSFPPNTVQVEVKQVNSPFFISDVTFHYGMQLHADDAVKARLQQDIDKDVTSVVGGYASGTQSVDGKVSWTKGTIGGSWWRISYVLGKVTSNVWVGVRHGDCKDNNAKSERTIGITRAIRNATNIPSNSSMSIKNYIVTKGCFYSLLPAGTYVLADEVKVGPMDNNYSIHNIASNVELIDNWQNSGRTMLKVSVSIPADMQSMYASKTWPTHLGLNFVLHDPYTNIVDRGGRVSPDVIFINTSGDNVIFNSNAKDSSFTGEGWSDWKYYKGIVSDGWSKGYEAATSSDSVDFGVVTALEAAFQSRVATDNDPTYQQSGTAYLGDSYTDQLKYTNETDTRCDNMVLYDVFSLDQENAVGSLESVDVSSIDDKVTYDANNAKTTDTCKPVVYYATEVPTDTTRPLDSGIWSTTAPSDLSKVKAIAIDCRKTDGGNDFVLDRKGTLVAYVHLKATTDSAKAGRIEKNKAEASKRLFVGTAPSDTDAVSVQKSDRTLKLLNADVSITKTSNPASGTQDKPAEIGNDADKQLIYKLTIKNEATDSSLPIVRNIHVSDQLPEGLSLDDLQDIKVTSSALGITGRNIGDQSAVSYQIDGQNLAFDVSKLPSNGTVTITIPVVRKDPVTQTTDYTNTATIDKVGKQENYNVDNEHASSTTYHRTSVTAMPLSGAFGFDGLIAAGGAVLVLSVLAWIRRRRHNGEA